MFDSAWIISTVSNFFPGWQVQNVLEVRYQGHSILFSSLIKKIKSVVSTCPQEAWISRVNYWFRSEKF